MSQKTLSELRLFVQNKLDIRDEDFINNSELLEYTEEALKFVEAEIHKLNIEDQYFEAHGVIALVNGRSDYALPSNIYANKILRVVYSSNGDIFAVKRMTGLKRYEQGESERYHNTASKSYSYRFVNLDPRVGTKMRFFPPSKESSTVVTSTATLTASSTAVSALSGISSVQPGYFVSGTGIANGTRVESVDSSTTVTLTDAAYTAGTGVTLTFTEPKLQLWYIRDVFIPTADTHYIDIPEFWPVVAQHIVVNCLKKELGNPRLQSEQLTLESMKMQMIDTLTNMVPDGDDELEADYGHFNEQGLEV